MLKKIIFLILFLNLFITSKSGFCGKVKFEPMKDFYTINTKRKLDDGTSIPLKIEFDYEYARIKQTQYSTKLNYLKSVFPNVKTFFNKALKVKNPLDKIQITEKDAKTLMSYIGINKLRGDFITGIDAHLVIIVIFEEEYSGTSTQAASTHITIEKDTRRPNIGYLAMNPSLSYTLGNYDKFFFYILIHEVSHILGFSDSFSFFKNSLLTKNVDGLEKVFLTSSKVLEKAREHFGCSTLDGVELENQGGEGSQISHWEARIMLGDYMISTSYPEMDISDITLALFEDSGWYEPDYSITGGMFKFGKNEGCYFLTDNCIYGTIKNPQTNYPKEFCLTNLGYRCSNNNLNKGICYLARFDLSSSIESRYLYLGEENYLGFEPADYCPVYYYYSYTSAQGGEDKNYLRGSCHYGTKDYDILGETIGSNSACFLSSLIQNNLTKKVKKETRAICHEIKCDEQNKKLSIIINGYILECPTDGGNINNPVGFSGTITCPSYEDVCPSSNSQSFCNSIFGCNSELSFTSTIKNEEDENYGTIGLENESSHSSFTLIKNSIYNFILFAFILI